MKFLGRVLLTLVLIAGLAVGGVWGASVLKINRMVKVKDWRRLEIWKRR